MLMTTSSDFSNQTFDPVLSQPLINPQIVRVFHLLCYGIVSEGIAVFGMGTNTINIICFGKQGFKESINISLLSLAISDLGCLITTLFFNVFLLPQFQELDLPFHPQEMAYLTSSVPHAVFTRITAAITAFISLERCLCIIIPLKVTRIFTPQRIAAINICIYMVVILTAVPLYFCARFAVKYYPDRNKTMLGLVFTEDRPNAETFFFVVQGVVIPFTALSIIFVCMIIMVTTLQKQAKWRRTQLAIVKHGSSLERDRKLVKMIVVISTLFVVCFFPSLVVFLLMALDPSFNYGGKYFDITLFIYGFSNIAETMNSSMNIFIYYRMSSRYRNQLQQMFLGKEATYK